MANTKKNDWFVVLLHQPEMDFQDMADNDVLPDNTSMGSREDYKGRDDVIQAFTENGKFNDVKFENYYKSALNMYNTYSESNFEKNLLDSYDYDVNDYFAPIDTKRRDKSPILYKNTNWDGRSSGLTGGLRGISDPTISAREAAQQLKVVDYQTGKDLDYTPEDKGGLFKSLARPTLVLSAWDEDGFHTVNGRQIAHSKGDLKFYDGAPRYEELGSRDATGKSLLKYEDTLTKEGSWINKYDFFDSDGLSKRPGGTIAKALFKTLPYLIPQVSLAYGAVTAGTALTQLIPTLMKSINGIAGGDNESDFMKGVTQFGNYAERFNSSVSDYSQSRMLSFENLGSLISDVSSQLYQQRVIAEIPRLLNSGVITKNVQKAGSSLSLAYMAATSSKEAYQQFKDAGASDQVAGLGMLASITAMYGLMRMDYFRNALFKGTYLDESDLKEVIKQATNASQNSLSGAAIGTPKEASNWLINFGNKITKAAETQLAKKASFEKFTGKTLTGIGKAGNKIGSVIGDNVYLSRAINEGLEEVSEEASADLVKVMFQGASTLGIPMNKHEEKLDFMWSGQDFAQRYLMNLFGGALGGPIFELHTRWGQRLDPTVNKIERADGLDQTYQELAYLAMDNRLGDVRDELTRLYQKGKLGDKNLSASNFETVEDSEGNSKLIAQAAEGTDNQNEAVYQHLMGIVNNLDNVVKSEGFKLSERELSDLGLGIRDRYTSEGNMKQYRALASKLVDDGIVSNIFQETLDLAVRAKTVLAKIKNIESQSVDPATNPNPITTSPSHNIELQRLQTELNEIRTERDKILNGEKAAYYFGQSLFVSDRDVHEGFVNLSKEAYTFAQKGISYNSLNEEDRTAVDEAYQNFMNTEGKQRAFRAYDMFLKINPSITRALQEIPERQSLLASGDINYAQIQQYDSQIAALEEEMKTLLENPEEKEESIQKISSKLQNIKALQQYYANNTSQYISPNIDGNDMVTVDNAQGQAESALNMLQFAINNKAYIDPSDITINSIVNNINKNIDQTALLESAFNDLILSETPITNFGHSWNNDEKNIFADQGLFSNGALDRSNSGVIALQSFTRNLGVDNMQAIQDWKKVVSAMEDAEYTNQMIQDITNSLLPMVGNRNIIAYLNEYYDLKTKTNPSPIYDLLAQFSIVLDGKPMKLIDLLRAQENSFAGAKFLEDYLIENDNVVAELGHVQTLLKMLEGVLNAATTMDYGDNNLEGFNHFVNLKRGELGEELLPTINSAFRADLQNDIDRINNRVNFLINLANSNKGQKLTMNKRIGMNIKQRLIGTLLSDTSNIKQKFKERFNVDLDVLWLKHKNNHNILGEINDENFGEFELALIGFESELFTELNDFGYNDTELADQIFDLVSVNELYKGKPTLLIPEQSIITDYDMLMYIASIVAAPSNSFYTSYARKLEDPELFGDKAPIFTQEYATRMGYSFHRRRGLFDSLLAKIEQTDSSKPIVSNNMFIYGGSGTGKTSAVDLLLRSMFDNSAISIVAPENEQVENLEKNLKDDIKNKWNKNEFMKKILGKLIDKNDYKYELKTNQLTLTKDYNPLWTPELFDGERVLFIDEISWFNSVELQKIATWADLNNVTVYASGDMLQNSVETLANIYDNDKFVKVDTIPGGIEDVHQIKTMTLVSTMRSANIGKTWNYNVLYTLLSTITDEYYDNPNWTSTVLAAKTKEFVTKTGIELKYFESNDDFFGEKVTDSDDEIKNFLNKVKTKGTAAIITDKPDNWNPFATDNITVIHPSNAQGKEWDYVIVDKSFVPNQYLALKDIYTMTQRSTRGTLIKRNNLRATLPEIKTVEDNTSGTSTSLSPVEITKSREERIDLLKRIEDNPDYKGMSSLSKDVNQTEQEVPGVITTTPSEVDNLSQTDSQSNVDVTQQPINSSNPIEEQNELQQESDISEKNTVAPKETVSTQLKESPRVNRIEYIDTPQVTYASNDEFIDWVISDNFIITETSNPNSLLSSLNLKMSKDEYTTTIATIGSYFKFWHNKDNSKRAVDNKRDVLNRSLRSLLDKKGKLREWNEIVAELPNAEYHVVPFNQQGLLVARINYRNSNVDIPILITSATNLGKYDGDIMLAGRPYFDSDSSWYARNLPESLNQNKMFKYYDQLIVVRANVEKEDLKQTPQGQWAKINNSKTFMLFTDDLLTTYGDFSESNNPTLSVDGEVTYLTSPMAQMSMMGVQRMMELSEAVIQAKSLLNPLAVDYERNGNKTNYKEYDHDYLQSINNTRVGQLLTIIASLAQTDDNIKRTLFTNMMDFINKKIHDNYSDSKWWTNRLVLTINKQKFTIEQNKDNGISYLQIKDYKTGKVYYKSLELDDPISPDAFYTTISEATKQSDTDTLNSLDPRTMLLEFEMINGKLETLAIKGNRTLEILTRDISDDDIIKLNESIKNSMFKNGIIGNDPAPVANKLATFIYNADEIPGGYHTTDATKLHGSRFVLDGSKFTTVEAATNPTSEELSFDNDNVVNDQQLIPNLPKVSFEQEADKVVDKLNKILVNQNNIINNFKEEYIKRGNNLNAEEFNIAIIDYLNNTFRKNQNTLFRIELTSDLRLQNVKDVNSYVLNTLGKAGFIQNVDDEVVQLVGTRNNSFNAVQLADGQMYYVELKDGENVAKEFKSFNEYNNLHKFASENIKQILELYPNAVPYIQSMITNIDATDDQTTEYMSIVENNPNDILLAQVDELIYEYLNARINNGECV